MPGYHPGALQMEVGGDFWDWVTNARTGSAASVLGVLLTAIGFLITIRNVYRSKGAAERAERASIEARAAIRLFDMVEEVATAVSAFERIKQLHRRRVWDALLVESYSTLRIKLVAIRHSGALLSDEHRSNLQSAVAYLADMESTVEGMEANEEVPNERIALFNARASEHMTKLQELLVGIKQPGTK